MKFKRGMTLAEVLLVFTIIGVIATFTVCSVRPWEKSYKYAYSRIYNALNLSIYNTMVKNSEFPEDIKAFCNGIFDYINTSETGMKTTEEINTKCQSIYDVGKGPTVSTKAASDAMFTVGRSIRLSNGMRIWLGADTGNGHKPFTTGGTDPVKFYMVYVDLNGDSKPNTTVWTKEHISDIVAMAVTDRYTVVPLGAPEIDIRYLQAHVLASSQSEEDDDFESDPFPYFYAKRFAFGWEDSGDNKKIVTSSEPLTMDDFNSALPESSPFRLDYNNVDERLKPLNMEPVCRLNEEAFANGYTNPPCKIKIYEYH